MRVKQLVGVLMILAMFALANTAPAIATDTTGPVGGCPDGFHLHNLDHHNHHGGHGDHKHVGNDKDLNGDGYICGKHVGKGGNVHVHIDNNVPLDGSE